MDWLFDPKPITRLREQLDLTPSGFGRKMTPPMTGAQVLDIEKRRRGVTVKLLLRLCNHFGLDPGVLFRKREGRKPPSGT